MASFLQHLLTLFAIFILAESLPEMIRIGESFLIEKHLARSVMYNAPVVCMMELCF